jgi:hypothetical protein
MLVGRRTRWLVAGGLVAMHVNILLLTGEILYWEAMVLLAVFAVVPDDEDVVTPMRTEAPVGGAPFVVAVVALVIASTLGIRHQAMRFRQSDQPTAPVVAQVAAPPPTAPPPPSEPPTTSPPTVQQIGPFVVGAMLVHDWAIERLTLGERGFVITLRGRAGNARFEVTCAASEHSSPFDVGAAHIFFFNDVPVDSLQDAGKALRETVRRAAGEVDVCEAIATWCGTMAS